jgi:hypothetical protein
MRSASHAAVASTSPALASQPAPAEPASEPDRSQTASQADEAVDQAVSGVKMEVSHQPQRPPSELWWWTGIVSGAVFLLLVGMRYRVGAR